MKMKKIIKCIIIFFIVFLLTANVALATEDSYMNPEQFDSYTTSNNLNTEVAENMINTILGNVLSVVRTIAFCLAMIMLIIMGIQYMTATPEMKGEVKKKQPLYITGVVLLFATSGVLQLITYFVGDTLQTS